MLEDRPGSFLGNSRFSNYETPWIWSKSRCIRFRPWHYHLIETFSRYAFRAGSPTRAVARGGRRPAGRDEHQGISRRQRLTPACGRVQYLALPTAGWIPAAAGEYDSAPAFKQGFARRCAE